MTDYSLKSLWVGGKTVWTIVETVDGVAKGGDHHWLYKGTAQRALKAYENGTAKHGDTVQQMRAAGVLS